MKITTNAVVRPLLCLEELPLRDQLDFDYVGADCTPRFVKYKSDYHDVLDTQVITTADNALPIGWAMRVEDSSPLAKWDRIASDSYWSGMLFRWVDDGVVVGRYTS